MKRTANVIDQPERFHILMGRTCTAENEIVITESIAANFDMNREGYFKIGSDHPNLWCWHYFLADSTQKGILLAEQKDLGIYKAIGFLSASLRLTFALRFAMAAVFGGLIGTILAAVITDPLVSSVMKLAGELVVRFGDGGDPFIMHLYDNDTAEAIARHVGTTDWRLPIYNYEGYENWEVMQYYDIPRRYEIPSNAETITEEAAGTVYYSEPNRVVLFYDDAEVTGEYTPVGYFDNTEEFHSAVEDNPVLEGWGNKIVQISDGE